MKKSLLTFVSFLVFGASASANGWTEAVTCELTRTSDLGEVVKSTESVTFSVAGPHNGESGSVAIESGLTPSYIITFDLITGGRYDLETLTTTLKSNSSVVAKSSVFDGGEGRSLMNTFVTESGDYIVSVNCSNSTVQ